MDPSRRSAILSAASLLGMSVGANAFLRARPARAATPFKFAADPFTLGVASGDPSADGFVIWTRLCPDPFDPGMLGDEVIEVAWTVARDPGFRQVLRKGVVRALPDRGHSVHVELTGLAPDSDYWYRFETGGVQSPSGRAITLIPALMPADRIKLAWASCQHFEQGWFTPYRDMIAWDPRMIIHTGDYIYESSWGPQVRRQPSADPTSLADYRLQHAVYKMDPDLQKAHAHTSWAFIWDDHDVANDYAGENPENPALIKDFAMRRAAGYRAYLENLPIGHRSLPTPNGGVRLFQRIAQGDLLALLFLDTRQWRSPRPCIDPVDWHSKSVSCAQVSDPKASVLGGDQEYWLQWVLGDGQAQWTGMVQTTLFSALERKNAQGVSVAPQGGWEAYPAARQRLLDLASQRKIKDWVVLGGDMHGFWASDVKADFAKDSPVIGAEFVTTSITSISQGYDKTKAFTLQPANQHIKHFDDRKRGYARAEVTRETWAVDFRQVDTTSTLTPTFSTQKSFVVERGRAGVQDA